MNLQNLQMQIKNKELEKFYVFMGDEIAVQKIYINKMAEVNGLELEYVESFLDVYRKMNSGNVFNAKKIYVVLDDTDLLKQEELWGDIGFEDNIIILKYNNIDKRSKFYKRFEDNIVEFNKLSDEVLIKYIQNLLPMLCKENCKRLIDICDSNYNQILLEVDKIRMSLDYPYNTPFDKNVDYTFDILLKQGAFHKDISDVSFDFADAVVRRDKKRAKELREYILKEGESSLGIISLLYNSIKTVLLIQICKGEDIAKVTGLKQGVIYYNREKTGRYTDEELVSALKLLHKVEKGIKTGAIDDSIALDYVLINIL